jgi:hypothetical protein
MLKLLANVGGNGDDYSEHTFFERFETREVTEYLQSARCAILIIIEEQYERVFDFRCACKYLVDSHPHPRQIIAHCRATDFSEQFAQHIRAILVVGRNKESTAAVLHAAFKMA